MPMSAEDQAWSDQYDQQQATQKAQEQQSKQPPSLMERFAGTVGTMTLNGLDSAVSAAESFANNDPVIRKVRDAQAGMITGATNVVDAAGSALASSGKGLAAAEDPEHGEAALGGVMPTSPIWDHAKASVMDFRDAVAVTDPTLSDSLVQGAAQIVPSFMGYSRLLGGLHGFANVIGAGALTDTTAMAPGDSRIADILALGRHAEGKFGDVIRRVDTPGSFSGTLLDHYINFLGHQGPDVSRYAVPAGDPAANTTNWDKREDGSDKGQGFLGLLKRPDGRVSSEISVGMTINGKDVEIPTLVPTLSSSEVDYLMTNEPDPSKIPQSILTKAADYARGRIAAGKSPFAGPGEQVTETEAESRWKNAVDGAVGNVAFSGLLHSAGLVFKYGTKGLRYAIDNGVGSAGDMVPKSAVAEGYQRQDMSLSPEERARVREGVASRRDAEEGITPEPTPEPIPRRAAETEGEAVRRDRADGVAAMATRGDGAGPKTLAGMPQPAASAADVSTGMTQNRNSVNALRTAITKFNEQGGPTQDAGPDGLAQQPFGQGMPLHNAITTLNKGLSRNTPQGAFYGEILDRLQDKKLPTEMVASGTGAHIGERNLNALGTYSDIDDTLAIHKGGLEGNNQTLLHTFVHEAVHAATMKAILETPEVSTALTSIFEDAEKSPAVAKLGEGDWYGLSRTAKYEGKTPIKDFSGKPITGGNPMVHEFAAEAEANPRFRQALKDTPSEHGGSLWDDYKAVIGGILGVTGVTLASPQFDKLLTKEKTGA